MEDGERGGHWPLLSLVGSPQIMQGMWGRGRGQSKIDNSREMEPRKQTDVKKHY